MLLHAEVFSGSAENCIFKLVIDTCLPGITVEKKMQLKQAGTADIAIRGDGKIVAAAGWDGRVRLFSCKTCAALALLKVRLQFLCIARRVLVLERPAAEPFLCALCCFLVSRRPLDE